MGKELKKVYLPAGLIASMYNLYGAEGKTDEVLSFFDVQVMCSYLEFYFNYTKTAEQKYIYRFYVMPQFYTGNINELQDVRVNRSYNKLKGKYIKRYRDWPASESGKLVNIAEILKARKKLRVEKLLQLNLPVELDPNLTPSSSMPNNAFEYGERIEEDRNFYLKELSEKRDCDGQKMFTKGFLLERSYFFSILPGVSKSATSKETFSQNEAEMKNFLNEFFNSDCYKTMAIDKSENYAPEVESFVDRFKTAVQAYKKLEFDKINKPYIPQIKSSTSKEVSNEAVGG